MDSTYDGNTNARTLYVGNLDPLVSEELLLALFTQIGPCKTCKLIHESTTDPYAFIEFVEHQAAAHALLAMNKRLVMGREIKVNWATASANPPNKIDTSKHYQIFVGDIPLDIDQNSLYEAFAPFGEISEIKIAKFPDTQRSKGYCFIAFTNENDAETAIASMNGQWLGTRKIRTNWATRKTSADEVTHSTQNRDSMKSQESSATKLTYNEVWNRTRDTNRTVYFTGCADMNDDVVRSLFEPFGHIEEIRILKDKYAFIRFNSKENACQAICHLHGTQVHGQIIKCSWGRDEQTNDQHSAVAYGNSKMNNQYDSYSQNSYGRPLHNNYTNDGSYHQPPSNSTWNSYPQSTNDNSGWNNDPYYEQNFNQYNNPQQSYMQSFHSGSGRSQR